MITDISYEYIKHYSFYEKGILPNGNGLNNESNKYIQAMMVLKNEFTKWQNKEANKN